ncbi:MAG: GNAT family N-acetyltransferase [Candidatus Coproplasma sp.]
MIKCYPLKDVKKDEFYRLFTEYYDELGCEDDAEHLLDEYVLADYLCGLLSIDLIDDGDRTVGFIIYQIDGIENEWCKKEGFGDVREIYVSPSARRKGLGKFMLFSAEMKLKESGAKQAYALPCEGSEEFFAACGYTDGGEYCEDLDCAFFVKSDLDNTCKCCK